MQPLHHRSANELADTLNELLGIGDDRRGRVLADERNGQLIIVATDSDYGRILELIRRLDVKIASTGQLHVMQLQHASCDEIAMRDAVRERRDVPALW